MKVLVTGGRNYRDREHLANVLGRYEITELAHGAAGGADSLADDYARLIGIEPQRFPANWSGPCTNMCKPGHRRPLKGSKTKTFCPAAGVYRNDDMLWEFKPDLVIAFPGGAGTADMVRRAIAVLGPERVIVA